MKVKYKQTFKNNNGVIWNIQNKVIIPNLNFPMEVDCCCKEMKNAWNKSLIKLQNYCLFPIIFIEQNYNHNPRVFHINFCPFCSEEITIHCEEVENLILK